MKITTDPSINTLANGRSSSVGSTNGDAAGSRGRVAATDSVRLSAGAHEFQQIRRAVDLAPDVRQEKVARISAAVADGSYRVPSADLADRILRTSLSEMSA